MSVLDAFHYKDLDALRVGRLNLGVNTSFVVYRLGDTIVDTGPSNQWKYLRPFVEQKPLRQLLLTHHHEDHSGNAGAIHRLTGVRPFAPELTRDILRRGFRIPPIQKVVWGSAGRVEAASLPGKIHIGDEEVIPLFSPGHARDMTCYLLPGRGWLFSADLYIFSRLKMARREEHFPTLISSIHKVLQQDFDLILCPHKGVTESGKQRLQEKFDYLLDLSARAQELRGEGLELPEIARRLLGRETILSLLSFYDFSKRNLVASCLEVDLSRYR